MTCIQIRARAPCLVASTVQYWSSPSPTCFEMKLRPKHPKLSLAPAGAPSSVPTPALASAARACPADRKAASPASSPMAKSRPSALQQAATSCNKLRQVHQTLETSRVNWNSQVNTLDNVDVAFNMGGGHGWWMLWIPSEACCETCAFRFLVQWDLSKLWGVTLCHLRSESVGNVRLQIYSKLFLPLLGFATWASRPHRQSLRQSSKVFWHQTCTLRTGLAMRLELHRLSTFYEHSLDVLLTSPWTQFVSMKRPARAGSKICGEIKLNNCTDQTEVKTSKMRTYWHIMDRAGKTWGQKVSTPEIKPGQLAKPMGCRTQSFKVIYGLRMSDLMDLMDLINLTSQSDLHRHCSIGRAVPVGPAPDSLMLWWPVSRCCMPKANETPRRSTKHSSMMPRYPRIAKAHSNHHGQRWWT